jgi:hypothetical protein
MTLTPPLGGIVTPLQLAGLEQQLSQTIGEILTFLPVLISAIVVLIVGFVIGRVLGGIVTRILERIGLSRYAQGTPLEQAGSGDAGFEQALGTLVAYYVYFVTVLAAADILQIPILSQLLAQLGAFLPTIIGAIVVLVLGFIVGRVVGDIVADLISGFGLGRFLQGTPLARFSDREGEFGSIVGTLISYYVYFLTILTAANVLQIAVLSRLLSQFAGYLPTLLGGLAVLIAGILIAEFVGDLVANTDRRRITSVLGIAVKVFIYYMTATLALDTIGFQTDVLTNLFNVFVVALFGSLGLAVAIGLGIGIGYGSREYIANNIREWVSGAQDAVSEDPGSGTGTGTGTGSGSGSGFDSSED